MPTTDETRNDLKTAFASRLHHGGWAWVILAVSLLVTFAAWYLSYNYSMRRCQDRFNFRVEETCDAIEDRLIEYQQVLRSGRGLFRVTDRVDRDQWKEFVSNLELDAYFPGIQGLGVAEFIPKDQKQDYEAKIQAHGFPEFEIRPDGDRPIYSAIVYLEPFDWRNKRAFGYDMYSNAVRRQAMDTALSTGAPAFSGKVTLVQETESDVQQGFLVYLTTGDVPSTDAEPYPPLVYAVFRANDLMNGILTGQTEDIQFKIFDENKQASNLMYDSEDGLGAQAHDAPNFSKDIALEVPGRKWLLHFESGSNFVRASETYLSTLVGVIGLLVDVFLFQIIVSIGRQRRGALRLANEMTKSLQSSEKKFRAVCNNVPAAIILLDDQDILQFANPAAISLFGKQLENYIAHESKNLPFLALLLRIPEQSNRSEGLKNETLELKTLDNRTIWVEAAVRHWRFEDSTFSVIGTRDVTEEMTQKRTIEETIANLERSNAELDDFAYVASHDLRSPLRNVFNLAKWLEEDSNGGLSSKCQHHLDRIQNRIKDMDRLLDDLLKYSRAGRAEDETRDVNTKQLLQGIVNSLSNPKGIAIRFLGDFPTVSTHATPLEICLRNLIGNALQHNHRDDGHIWLSAAKRSGFLVFRVADDGPGIAQDSQDRIFKIFQTLQPTQGTQQKSSGVGLAIVKKTAESCGGKVVVQSEEGKGATFELHWKVAKDVSNRAKKA